MEAKVSFNSSGGDTSVSLAVPNDKDGFKILNEEITAKGYEVSRNKKDGRIVMTGKNKSGRQNLYYRLSIYDDAQNRAAN